MVFAAVRNRFLDTKNSVFDPVGAREEEKAENSLDRPMIMLHIQHRSEHDEERHIDEHG